MECLNKNRKVSASKNVSGLVFISLVSSFLPVFVLLLFVHSPLFISLYPTIKTGEVEGQRRGSIGGGGDSTVTLVVTLVTGVACACVEGPPRIDQPIPTSFPLLNT